MKFRANRLRVGDVLRLHDWRLHGVRLERGLAVGVVTSEFGFIIHFASDEVVDVAPRSYSEGHVRRAA